MKPSHHRDWLAADAPNLESVTLSSGETVRACRRRRMVHGQEQTVVTLFSSRLCEGQRRGLDQHLATALKRLHRISAHPRDGVAGARRQIERIVNRQYIRNILRYQIHEKDGTVSIVPSIDQAARLQIEQTYFGLRLLATTREDWTTAQIIEAYRGQSRVEGAFRDLKDPWACAFRPQYHWTDQKLTIHALIVMLSLLLGRVLLRRAQRAGFAGGLRALVQRLNTLRTATVLVKRSASGRPQVRQITEECDSNLHALAAALHVPIP